MLEVIGTGSTSLVTQDWHDTWLNSYDAAQLEDHLIQLHAGHTMANCQFHQSPQRRSRPLGRTNSRSLRGAPSCRTGGTLSISFQSLRSISSAACLVGLSFKNTPNTIQGTENKLFVSGIDKQITMGWLLTLR